MTPKRDSDKPRYRQVGNPWPDLPFHVREYLVETYGPGEPGRPPVRVLASSIVSAYRQAQRELRRFAWAPGILEDGEEPKTETYRKAAARMHVSERTLWRDQLRTVGPPSVRRDPPPVHVVAEIQDLIAARGARVSIRIPRRLPPDLLPAAFSYYRRRERLVDPRTPEEWSRLVALYRRVVAQYDPVILRAMVDRLGVDATARELRISLSTLYRRLRG